MSDIVDAITTTAGSPVVLTCQHAADCDVWWTVVKPTGKKDIVADGKLRKGMENTYAFSSSNDGSELTIKFALLSDSGTYSCTCHEHNGLEKQNEVEVSVWGESILYFWLYKTFEHFLELMRIRTRFRHIFGIRISLFS